MVEFIKLGRPDACERELAHLPKKIVALAAGRELHSQCDVIFVQFMLFCVFVQLLFSCLAQLSVASKV